MHPREAGVGAEAEALSGELPVEGLVESTLDPDPSVNSVRLRGVSSMACLGGVISISEQGSLPAGLSKLSGPS